MPFEVLQTELRGGAIFVAAVDDCRLQNARVLPRQYFLKMYFELTMKEHRG
jgi:hypothetical protein